MTEVCAILSGIEAHDFSRVRLHVQSEKLQVDMEEYQESAVTLANRLLGGIVFDALRSFKDTLDSELDSGETQMIGGVD